MGSHGGSRDAEEAEETFVLCPERGCEELILVTDLNDHLDFHDAQQASTGVDEDAPPPSLPARRLNSHSSSSYSSSSTASSSVSPYHGASNSNSYSSGSSTGDSSSRTKSSKTMDVVKSQRDAEEDDRAHIGRRFLTKLKPDSKRSKERVPSNKAASTMQRLGKAELGES